MPSGNKHFNFICDCYRTACVLYIALYFIPIEHSDVKLCSLKKSLCEGKLGGNASEITQLCNYIVILLLYICVA